MIQKDCENKTVTGVLPDIAQNREDIFFIVAIIIGAAVTMVLYIIALCLVLNNSNDENWEVSIRSMNKTENSATNHIDTLMSSGKYEDAIQMILDVGLDETEGADQLQKAIDALYSQCIDEISSLSANNDYDAAFEIIDGRMQYFTDIADQAGYVVNKHESDLGKQRDQLIQEYVADLYQTAQICSNDGDENGMLEALDKISAYTSSEEMEKKKTELYTNLVLITMTNMNTSGESAENIAQYIDSNLRKTGNNCRLLEFWEYYDDVYHKQIGKNRMTVTKIHVSDAGYILPDSNLRILSYSDIDNLTEYELYFALFEIYARHNRIFSDSVVISHFQKYSWYSGDVSPENFDENVLSEIEKQNINTIISYQRNMGYR